MGWRPAGVLPSPPPIGSAVADATVSGDYAVEFEARFDGPGYTPDKPSAFGLMLRAARASGEPVCPQASCFVAGEPRPLGGLSPASALLARAIARQVWQPGAAWHVYRFVSKDDRYSLMVDRVPVLAGESSGYHDGHVTGIWAKNAAISVRAFRL